MQKDWQILLKEALTSPTELILQLELDPQLIPAAEQAAQYLPLRIPRGFLARIKKGDPNDPLLRQILPLAVEQQSMIGYSHDPLNEQASNPCSGLLHKYAGRVLVTLTSAGIVFDVTFLMQIIVPAAQRGKRFWLISKPIRLSRKLFLAVAIHYWHRMRIGSVV